jgi:hypothetical protein
VINLLDPPQIPKDRVRGTFVVRVVHQQRPALAQRSSSVPASLGCSGGSLELDLSCGAFEALLRTE